MTSSDLNAEFNNIINNALSLISPLTGALAAGGNDITGLDELAFDDASTNASAAGRLRRNSTALTWHDGTAARTVLNSNSTVTTAKGGTGGDSSGSTGLAKVAAGTWSYIDLPVKIWLPAAGADSTVASSIFDLPESNAPVATAYGTSPNKFGALDFADGANALTCQFTVHLPSDWNVTDGIDIKYVWFSGSTSTNSAVWTCATASVADTEDMLAPTFNTAQTVADANLAVASTRNSCSITGVTTTGMAAGELAIFRIGRDPTDGSDTLAATAALIGVELTYRRRP